MNSRAISLSFQASQKVPHQCSGDICSWHQSISFTKSCSSSSRPINQDQVHECPTLISEREQPTLRHACMKTHGDARTTVFTDNKRSSVFLLMFLAKCPQITPLHLQEPGRKQKRLIFFTQGAKYDHRWDCTTESQPCPLPCHPYPISISTSLQDPLPSQTPFASVSEPE